MQALSDRALTANFSALNLSMLECFGIDCTDRTRHFMHFRKVRQCGDLSEKIAHEVYLLIESTTV